MAVSRPSPAHLSPTPADRPVYVIGAGPGGLAAAYALRARGVRTVVLEKSDRVGASWRRHYDRLHLHTTRRLSALPGLAIPRRFGRWVSRDDLVRYLEKYAEHHRLEIVTGVEVHRVERTADGTGWLLHASGGRELTGSAVVVATGFNHTPRLPRLAGPPGGTAASCCTPPATATPSRTGGRDVLVVGIGNTGAEIAVDLAGGRGRAGTAGGAHAAAHPAPVDPRLGRPVHGRAGPAAAGVARGPARRSGGAAQHPRPVRAQPAASGHRPVQQGEAGRDPGAGRRPDRRRAQGAGWRSWPPWRRSEDGEVVLADGSRISPDAVIAATGYVRALEGLVGHLGVLDGRGRPVVHGGRTPAQAPGLYFTGFTNPISGMLRELAIDAGRIAKAVARRVGAGTR